MSDTQIMYDSPEAAQPVTVTAWRSMRGNIYIDELAARHESFTHALCLCGDVVARADAKFYQAVPIDGKLLCRDCWNDEIHAGFMRLEAVDWDGVSYMYSQSMHMYFATPQDAVSQWNHDEVEEETEPTEDMQLLICEPILPTEFSATDLFEEFVNDEDELPFALEMALDDLNSAIRDAPDEDVRSWKPTDKRLRCCFSGQQVLEMEGTEHAD